MEQKYYNPNANVEYEIKISDYIRIFSSYKWLILGVFVMVLSLTFLYTIRAPKIYRSRVRALIETVSDASMFMFSPLSGNKAQKNIMEILQSKPVMSRAIDIMKQHPAWESFPASSKGVPELYLLGGASVDEIRDTEILNIRFESTSPLEAQAAADAITLALSQENTQYARKEYTSTRVFLENQLTSISTRLQNSEEDLRAYKLDQGISVLNEETKNLILLSSNVEAQQQLAKTESSIAAERLRLLRGQLGKQDSLLSNVNLVLISPLLEQLRHEIIQIEVRLARLLSKPNYNSNHPEMVALNKELQNSKDRMKTHINRLTSIKDGTPNPIEYRGKIVGEIAMAKIDFDISTAKLISLEQTVEDINRKMTVLPDTELELARLERTYRINEKVYELLVEKFEDIKIAEQATMGDIRIIEEAFLPVVPVKPRKKVNLVVGAMFGLMLGIGFALLLHSMDTKFRSLDQIERTVQLPILGTIPFIKMSDSEVTEVEEKLISAHGEEKEALQTLYSQLSGRLISAYSPKSPVAESYRTLRTNAIANRKNLDFTETFLITSSGPKEGKSTTTANLAITFAQMDAKTVLMDVDLRRPMIHNIFHLNRTHGISDFLMNKEKEFDLDGIIKKSGVPNLDIITSGLVPPNPSEIISSNKMDELLGLLKRKYDYIIVDSPPIIAVTDALILAKKVDQMILVIRNEFTEQEAVKRAKVMLENVNIAISGIVVNGINHKKYYRGGYSYYNYYYYYYDDTKSAKKKS